MLTIEYKNLHFWTSNTVDLTGHTKSRTLCNILSDFYLVSRIVLRERDANSAVCCFLALRDTIWGRREGEILFSKVLL